MNNLTITEQIIYKQLLKNKTEKEIAEELYISVHTVKSYVNMISIKLGIIK